MPNILNGCKRVFMLFRLKKLFGILVAPEYKVDSPHSQNLARGQNTHREEDALAPGTPVWLLHLSRALLLVMAKFPL